MPQQVDYAALARQFGGTSQGSPAPPAGPRVDYESLAKQFGATMTTAPDRSNADAQSTSRVNPNTPDDFDPLEDLRGVGALAKRQPRMVGGAVGGAVGSLAGPFGTAAGTAYGDTLAAKLAGEDPTMAEAIGVGVLTAAGPAVARGVGSLAQKPIVRALAGDAAEWVFPRTARIVRAGRGALKVIVPEASHIPATVEAAPVTPGFNTIADARGATSLKPDKYAARDAAKSAAASPPMEPPPPRWTPDPADVEAERAFKRALLKKVNAPRITPEPAHAPAAPTAPARETSIGRRNYFLSAPDAEPSFMGYGNPPDAPLRPTAAHAPTDPAAAFAERFGMTADDTVRRILDSPELKSVSKAKQIDIIVGDKTLSPETKRLAIEYIRRNTATPR